MTRSKAVLVREWAEAQLHDDARAIFLDALTADEHEALFPAGASPGDNAASPTAATEHGDADTETPAGEAKTDLVAIAQEG